jgi:DNA polymerase V
VSTSKRHPSAETDLAFLSPLLQYFMWACILSLLEKEIRRCAVPAGHSQAMSVTKAFPVAGALPVESDSCRATSPLFLSPAQAGFPSPADDYVDRKLDLHEHLVRNSVSTFFLRASGDSMIRAGIRDGDLLVADRSLRPVNGCVVVAAVGGELTIKYFVQRRGRALLVPANEAYPELDVTEREDAVIWGVVTYAVHKLAPCPLGAG